MANEREFFKQTLYGAGPDEGLYLPDDVPLADTFGGSDYPRFGIGSLAAGLKHLTDDSTDDLEEQRKRIEAERNGEAIGMLLGTAARLIGALSEDDGEDFDDEDYENGFGQSLM